MAFDALFMSGILAAVRDTFLAARVEEILRLWQDRASLDGRKTGGLYFRELL